MFVMSVRGKVRGVVQTGFATLGSWIWAGGGGTACAVGEQVRRMKGRSEKAVLEGCIVGDLVLMARRVWLWCESWKGFKYFDRGSREMDVVADGTDDERHTGLLYPRSSTA